MKTLLLVGLIVGLGYLAWHFGKEKLKNLWETFKK